MILILAKEMIIACGMYSKLLGSLCGKRMMEICDPYWVITSLSFHNIACKIEGLWFWKLRKFVDGLWIWCIQVLFWQLEILFLSLFELQCQSCFPFSCSWKKSHFHKNIHIYTWTLNLLPRVVVFTQKICFTTKINVIFFWTCYFCNYSRHHLLFISSPNMLKPIMFTP
jgi:hypothetical protein